VRDEKWQESWMRNREPLGKLVYKKDAQPSRPIYRCRLPVSVIKYDGLSDLSVKKILDLTDVVVRIRMEQVSV
jgi:hypothetical protein